MGSNDYGVVPVWEILNRFGVKTGLINIPMTHPPEKINGFMMTWPLSNTLRYSYPDHLLLDIAEHNGHYASDLNLMYTGDDSYIEKSLEVTRKRLQAAKYLIKEKEWELLVCVFTEIDRISHYYWHDMEQSPSKSEDAKSLLRSHAIEKIYRETDKALGEILEILTEDTLFLVMSDHGFRRGEFDFYIQSFLMEHSMLYLKPAGLIAEEERRCLKNSWFACMDKGQEYYVDWSKTIAYMACPGSYGVNINLQGRQKKGIVKAEEYERVRSQVIACISSATLPGTNIPMFEQVVRREEIYHGGRIKDAPDILMIPSSYGIMVHHKIVPGTLYGRPEQNGLHDRAGILGLYGKSINYKIMKEDIYLEDIAPTILNYFGLAKGDYMDGASICNFNRGALIPWEYPLEGLERYSQEDSISGYTEQEKLEAEEKLKALGYL